MADRIVYLVEAMPKKSGESTLELVTDDTLGDILAEGWETSTTIPGRTIKVAGKAIEATMMVLKKAADNRGLVARGREDDDDSDVITERRAGGSNVVLVKDQFGNDRPMSVQQAMLHAVTTALANVGESGHLGAAKNHSMPGLTIISAEMTAKAFDVGVMAGRRGDDVSSCPFPLGGEVAQRWLKGFRLGERQPTQSVDKVAALEAHQRGLQDSKDYGQNDEVSCPYPHGSPLREHWLNGFREGGGRVE